MILLQIYCEIPLRLTSHFNDMQNRYLDYSVYVLKLKFFVLPMFLNCQSQDSGIHCLCYVTYVMLYGKIYCDFLNMHQYHVHK